MPRVGGRGPPVQARVGPAALHTRTLGNMRRIMGTEIEYGISVPGDPTANPVLTSTQVVLAYAAAAELPRARRARWDYEVESALRAATVPGNPPVQLYKNNVDGKGASYGAHENYLMARSTPFTAVIAGLTPFFVSRQVVCGSGRVGIGPSGQETGYQPPQRSDYN